MPNGRGATSSMLSTKVLSNELSEFLPRRPLTESLISRVEERLAGVTFFLQRLEESFLAPPRRRPLGRLPDRMLEMAGRAEGHQVTGMIAPSPGPRDDVMHLQALPPVATSTAAERGIEHLAPPFAERYTAPLASVAVPPQHRVLHPIPYQAPDQVGSVVPIWQLACSIGKVPLALRPGLAHSLQRRLG